MVDCDLRIDSRRRTVKRFNGRAEVEEEKGLAEGTARATARRATIRDVAQHAHVSVGTVSHVLNGSKNVSEGTRDAVMRAVADLDYRPNSLARSLIARRPRTGNPPRNGRSKLICVGYISIDYMVRISGVPQPGDRATSTSIEKMLGGPAANVAAFAATLGEPFGVTVEMVTHLGDDADSLWALEELASRHIDASGALQQQGGRLSRCIVLVEETGRRTIINEPFHLPLEFLSRHLSHNENREIPACIHFDGFHRAAAEQVRDELRDAGYLMSLHSAGLARDRQTPEDGRWLLETFDILCLDSDTFRRLFEISVDVALSGADSVFDFAPQARCRALTVTRGADGASLFRPGKAPVSVSAPMVDIVDATGAGDAFTGVFLASWLAGCGEAKALTHAVAGASLSLSALGAQGRLVSAKDLGWTHDEVNVG
jgi:sugar/nucleoside kinase (ribokinase family)